MKVNKHIPNGLFMKPAYNTINDTYQDPYKLGKYSYQNNTAKNPVFVEPWKSTHKNGQVFSRFEYISPDETKNFKKTIKNGEIGFEEETENGNQQAIKQNKLVSLIETR